MVIRRAREWEKIETVRYRESVRSRPDKVAAHRFLDFQSTAANVWTRFFYDSFYSSGETHSVAGTLSKRISFKIETTKNIFICV